MRARHLIALVAPLLLGMTATATAELTTVDLPAEDLVHDPISGLIYASVSNRLHGYRDHVVAIDPADGSIAHTIHIGSEPDALAVSPDGRFLYVGLNGAHAIRRVPLATRIPEPIFSLGPGPGAEDLIAYEIEVLPDAPGSVAVSRRVDPTNGTHAGVAVYDDGVMRPSVGPNRDGRMRIEFAGSGDRVFGVIYEDGALTLRVMQIDGGGITETDALNLSSTSRSLGLAFVSRAWPSLPVAHGLRSF